MSRPLTQVGDEVREMNDDEFSQYQLDLAESKKRQEELETKESQRQAIADRLGLTIDELKILLG